MAMPGRSVELLWADLALARGLVTPDVLSQVLRGHWETAERSLGHLTEAVAALGVARTELEELEQEVVRLVAEAGGSAHHALARRGHLDHAIRLTVSAQRAASGRLEDTGTEGLRTVPEGRFSDFLVAGEGGMGVVYMAYDTEMKRFVALKMIRPPMPDGTRAEAPSSPLEAAPTPVGASGAEHYAELRHRFLQEAWITGGLEHPGIVPVYEVGRTPKGMPFYTMRFVSGHRTLADAIDDVRNGGLAGRLALLEPFLKVCDAVQFAHSHGVVHRDLKPANVALGEYGEVLVLDWGLAKALGKADGSDEPWVQHVGEFRATHAFETQAQAIGTPGYMPPEAALELGDVVDPRSDVYSLGAILYEILTGRLPHEAESLTRWMASLRTGPPPEPAGLDPTVPAGLSGIAASALATDRTQRPAHAGRLAERIRAWQVADAESRELERLERDAGAALERAETSRGDERLRGAEHAALLAQQVLRIRSHSASAASLAERAGHLRARALRERTWRVLSRPLAAVTAVVVIVVGTMLFLERGREAEVVAAVDAALTEAESALQGLRVEAALEKADGARAELESARGQAAFDHEAADDRRRRHFQLLCDACVQGGDLGRLARTTAAAFTAEELSARLGLRSIAARAFAQLGVFEVVAALLNESRLTSASERDCLREACCWLGDEERARRIAGGSADGGGEALRLLDRFTVLRRVPVSNAISVTVVRVQGEREVVATTADGRLLRWNARTGERAWVRSDHELYGATVCPSRGSAVFLAGKRSRDGSVLDGTVLELELPDGTPRPRVVGLKGPPRTHVLDLDGDGSPELVLTFKASGRGVAVYDLNGQPWPEEHLGDLTKLLPSDTERRPDVCDACLEEEGPHGRCLLLAAADWHAELGYQVLRFRWDDAAKSLRQVTGARHGVVTSLARADVAGDRRRRTYFTNSYLPLKEHERILEGLDLPGVYRLDDAGSAASALRTISSGFYRASTDELALAPVSWQFLVHKAETSGDRCEELAVTASVGEPGRWTRTALEGYANTGGRLASTIVPGVEPLADWGATVLGDVLSSAPGVEIVVAGKDPGGKTEIVIVGDRRGLDAGRGDAVQQPAGGPRVAGLAQGSLRLLAGALAVRHPDVAAELYEAHGIDTLDAVDCWIRAGDAARAHRALARMRAAAHVPHVERMRIEGRIAANDHRAEDARAAFEDALSALDSARPDVDAGARAEELRRALSVEQARLTLPRYEPTLREEHRRPPGLPTGWLSSRPRMVEALDGTGLLTTLHGMRRDFVVREVDSTTPHHFRVWARIVVHEQLYGSQLSFGFSQAALPGEPARQEREDAAWLSLEHADSLVGGVSAACRLAGEVREERLHRGTEHRWEVGRPLYLEVDYDSRLRSVRCVCRDEISDRLVARIVLRCSQPAQAGRFRIGFWGAPLRNPWSNATQLQIEEMGYEIWSDGGSPYEQGQDHERSRFEAAWAEWLEARRPVGEIAQELARGMDASHLAGFLVGPRPASAEPLLRACLDALPELGATLRRPHEVGTTRPLIALDPRLLLALRDEPFLADDGGKVLIQRASEVVEDAERRRRPQAPAARR